MSSFSDAFGQKDLPMELLVPILGGAVGAALLGLLGAWIQSRREHARWLREKRYDAYLQLVQGAEREVWLMRVGVEKKKDHDTRLAIRDALAEVGFLGPNSVRRAQDSLQDALTELEQSSLSQSLEFLISVRFGAFVTEARKAVGINMKEPKRFKLHKDK